MVEMAEIFRQHGPSYRAKYESAIYYPHLHNRKEMW
jgi:hypothetical protein